MEMGAEGGGGSGGAARWEKMGLAGIIGRTWAPLALPDVK